MIKECALFLAVFQVLSTCVQYCIDMLYNDLNCICWMDITRYYLVPHVISFLNCFYVSSIPTYMREREMNNCYLILYSPYYTTLITV